MKLTQKHELKCLRECNLASDGLIWNDGYDKAVCTCGWTSTPIRGKDKATALVALFEIHVRQASRTVI